MKDYRNYHTPSMLDKVTHDGHVVFEYTLANGTDSFDTIINGNPHRVVLQSATNDATGEKRTVICHLDLINRGTVIEVGDVAWLVTSVPALNPVYAKAVSRLCNSSITIAGKRVPIAWDSFGNPMDWTTEPDTVLICVAEKSLVYSFELDKPVNLPDNKIKITLPFMDVDFERFSIYDEIYVVRDVDYTKSIDGVGIVSITGERTVSNGNV